jgi:hypothetical protein
MQNDLMIFYQNAIKFPVLLSSLFKESHPCYPLALQMAKYPFLIHEPESPTIDFICLKLNLTKQDFENQLAFIHEMIGALLIKDELRGERLIHCCTHQELKSKGSVFIAKQANGILLTIETPSEVLLNVGDKVVTEIFPNTIEGSAYRISRKIGRIDGDGFQFIYHLDPLSYDEYFK